MKPFNADDYPNKTCCGVMEHIVAEGYTLPFYHPISITQDLHTLKALPWSIRVMKQTPSGGLARRGAVTMIMSYCPFCGKKVEDNGT